MKIWLSAAGTAKASQTIAFRAQPDFRKATRNMLWAVSAVTSLIPAFSKAWFSEQKENLALILGTSHGELDPTIQFLKGLGATGVARPFLFQNSLHNATLGFLTQHLGASGPGFTVSHHHFSGEDSLQLAVELLHSHKVQHALVVGVDSLVPGFESTLTHTYPEGTVVGEGAGAVLLSTEKFGTAPLAELCEIKMSVGRNQTEHTLPDAYYDSGAIEALAKLAVTIQSSTTLRLRKPDGTHSSITLEAFQP